METHLIPHTSDLSANIKRWSLAYRPILNNPKFGYQDPELIDSLLCSTLREYVMNTNIYHHGRIRTGLPSAEYPAYFNYWNFLRYFTEAALAIIHHYQSTLLNSASINNFMAAQHLNVSDARSLVVQYTKKLMARYHGRKYDLSVGLAQSVDCADRLMWSILDKQTA